MMPSLPLTLVPVAADEHARPAAAVAVLSGFGGQGDKDDDDEDEGAGATPPPHVLSLDPERGVALDAAPLGPRGAVPWDGGMAERALLRVAAPPLAQMRPRGGGRSRSGSSSTEMGVAAMAVVRGGGGGGDASAAAAVLASTPMSDVVRLEWLPLPPTLALAQARLLRTLQRAALSAAAAAAAAAAADGDEGKREAATAATADDDDHKDDTDEVDADALRVLLLDAPPERRARVLDSRCVRRAARRWAAALNSVAAASAAMATKTSGQQHPPLPLLSAAEDERAALERAVMRLVEDECAGTAW
jgi:hypothetical protein